MCGRVAASIGYLKGVTAWRRVGVKTSGNLIVYGDSVVFVATRWRDLPRILISSDETKVFDRLAAEQSQHAPNELVVQKRRNWVVYRDDIAEARFGITSSGGGGAAGDTIVDLALGVALAASAVKQRTLEIELNGGNRRKDPRVAGGWGDAEINLLRRALGDKLDLP